MGMDLSPRNRKCDSFHLNWTGWGVFCDLVEQLGCDTSALSGSNDGDYIPAPYCRAFAEAIREAIRTNRIYKVLLPDSSYAGSYRERLLVRDAPAIGEAAIKEVEREDGSKICPLDKEQDIDWLNNICDFLDNCSGCRQY